MHKDSSYLPLKRSQLRLRLGRYFYICRRYWDWYFSPTQFATHRSREALPHVITTHHSTLIRHLKNVEMWLQYNKVTNLRLALERINGIIINPGEVFSFWFLVGNPTKSRGFELGMTLQNGKVKPGYGGGLCQLSNLIYWMTLHTPLKVKERWRHSYDVFPDVNRVLPFGSGATVSYNYIDLQIENCTAQKFQLLFELTDENLCGEIRADDEGLYDYAVVEKNHQITGPVSGCYVRHNQLFRQVKEPGTGQLIQEELVAENHALMMYAPLLNPSQSR